MQRSRWLSIALVTFEVSGWLGLILAMSALFQFSSSRATIGMALMAMSSIVDQTQRWRRRLQKQP